MDNIHIVDLSPESVGKEGLFCIKNPKDAGFTQKQAWFERQYKAGLRLKLLKDDKGAAIAFVEYMPAENAWRPIQAEGFMFIHCLLLYGNKHKGKGYGSMLLEACEEDARSRGMKGVCVMTSKGTWMARRALFDRNGYEVADQKGRFELMAKEWGAAEKPQLLDWEALLANYQGWHLIYADQCPWHDKAAKVLRNTAELHGIELQVFRMENAEDARHAPSGFGVFALIRDGRLLADHYISDTRFKNILKKEGMSIQV